MAEKIKLLTGNINRKIYKAKTGDTIKCSGFDEAVMLYTMAKRYCIDVSRRNAQVKFHSEIDRTKYEWVSGEPVKDQRQPRLKGVE